MYLACWETSCSVVEVSTATITLGKEVKVERTLHQLTERGTVSEVVVSSMLASKSLAPPSTKHRSVSRWLVGDPYGDRAAPASHCSHAITTCISPSLQKSSAKSQRPREPDVSFTGLHLPIRRTTRPPTALSRALPPGHGAGRLREQKSE